MIAFADEKTIAITHAKLYTVTHGTLNDATLIVKGRKIIAIGNEIVIPPNAEILDATGKSIAPGFIDPHSHLGDYSIPGNISANDDGNEATGNIQARVRSMDSINPEDPEIARAVSGGVTMVQVLPGSANNVGGQAVIIKLLGNMVSEMRFAEAPPTMKMAWGENPKNVYGRKSQSPSTLMGEMAAVRQAFYDAKRYSEDRAKSPSTQKKDLTLDALADVVEGKTRIHVHSYQISHFDALFRLQDEFHLMIAALHHALNAYKIADEIAKRNIGVVTFSNLWGYKAEAWDAIPQNAWILWKKGITVSFHTDNPVMEEKYYVMQATMAVHYGLPEDVALQMLTINPAKLLGIDPWVGSLDPGKDADISLWSGNPLSPRSHVERVWINGELVYTQEEGYLPWKGRDIFVP